MKKLILFSAIAVVVCAALSFTLKADGGSKVQIFEYATLRWAGRENTHVIRPGGQVEFVGNQLIKLKKPDHTDDRAFYMNAVMNAMAKDGFEYAGMTSDDIIMKRLVAH
jgi:hypothetical protein